MNINEDPVLLKENVTKLFEEIHTEYTTVKNTAKPKVKKTKKKKEEVADSEGENTPLNPDNEEK